MEEQFIRREFKNQEERNWDGEKNGKENIKYQSAEAPQGQG